MTMKGKSMSGHRPGGGIASNKRTEKPVRTGVNARAMSPRGVSQIGQNMGNHVTEGKSKARGAVEPVRGALKPDGKPGGIPLGNAVATNVGAGGPGTGRECFGACGSQGTYSGQDYPTKVTVNQAKKGY
jgi:hypothetical protein